MFNQSFRILNKLGCLSSGVRSISSATCHFPDWRGSKKILKGVIFKRERKTDQSKAMLLHKSTKIYKILKVTRVIWPKTIWPTGIWPTKCLVVAAFGRQLIGPDILLDQMSVGQEVFDQKTWSINGLTEYSNKDDTKII